jgi:putative pyruvate formate lyase activating enzyme
MAYPSFCAFDNIDFNTRIDALFESLKSCDICPRRCGVNRIKGKKGYCNLGTKAMISSYGPHFGEESVLVGRNGSGTIFFTSCNLSCVFCQNYEISHLREGEEISEEGLASVMIKLQNLGCHNVNLVSPTSHVPAIVKAIKIARNIGLKIPLVYNTNSYDSVETLALLNGIIDIYMPDFKYSDNTLAKKYSDAPNYFGITKSAITEMQRQVGDLVTDENKIALKGLIIRHLIMPEGIAGTEKIVEFIAEKISKNAFLNIMDQYHPCFEAFKYPQISRRITVKEYRDAILLAQRYSLKRIYKETTI